MKVIRTIDIRDNDFSKLLPRRRHFHCSRCGARGYFYDGVGWPIDFHNKECQALINRGDMGKDIFDDENTETDDGLGVV